MPSRYNVVRPRTFDLWLPWRRFLVDGDPKPGVDLVNKFTRIYPLSAAGKPAPDLKFVDMSQKPFNTVRPAHYRFWELLNQVVQEEPDQFGDAEWVDGGTVNLICAQPRLAACRT